jgi:hypothetical protein
MMMPYLSERRPQHQCEKCYRDNKAPDSLLIKHVLGARHRPVIQCG